MASAELGRVLSSTLLCQERDPALRQRQGGVSTVQLHVELLLSLTLQQQASLSRGLHWGLGESDLTPSRRNMAVPHFCLEDARRAA